ncbi:hypothetical protein Bmayo_04655 (plasmid) [Borreliella mayonii]|uniref:Uncharacterized protein n=1 Tax=Borreliella mayonii TaxID=1674146 RepID=A0AAC9KYB6_9SPIR|nr:hypothetical protein A7X70_05875 [Borreliella mayonii]APT00438.1 hypothetical protein Bmayo_04655 [Borreliella mayonii]
MLSLWINPFIFETPPSFIEHHIKVGNALLGYAKDEFFILQKRNFKVDFLCLKKELKKLQLF